ncbi:MAG: hypothetical protein AB7D06_17125 [Pedobacter sp.]
MATCNGLTISCLISTSVDDCRSSLQIIDNIPFLLELLARCERCEHHTRAQVVRRRIRQIEKRK